MAAFTWKKAAPGDYYLWEEVPGQSKLAHVGRVWRVSSQDYAAKFFCGPHHLEFRGHSTPRSRMEHLEGQIRTLLPDATFTRAGF